MNHFNMNNFMPHGHCYLWRTDILLMNVISDVLISLCYLSIPLLLLIIVTKRKDLPFKSTIIVFILFIFFCAITHIFEIINVWIPLYFITGIVKVITAIISVISTFIILKNLNKILSLPSFKGIETKMFNEMEHIVEKLPVGVIHSDSSGLIKFHNNYINEKFGFSKEELHNQAVEILIPEHKRDQHIQYRESYYKENEIEKKMGEGRILTGKTKDGDSLFLEIGLQPITLEHSKQKITIITINDVTKESNAKKQLEVTNKLLDATTDSIPSLLSYIDSSGHYRFVNEAYIKNWNLEKHEIINRHYTELLPRSTAAAVKKKMDAALNGEELNFNITVNFPSTGIRDLEVFYIPDFKGNKINGVTVLAHDITDINKTLLKLEVSNRQLEEYAFLVSHDLRAPIRHIINFIELLEKNIQNDEDFETRERYFDIIKKSSVKAQNMISGILKLASISQIAPKMEQVDLVKLLEHQKSDYQEKANITIHTDKETIIESDIDLLTVIFQNLLENSLKFSNKDNVEINITIRSQENAVNIVYTDNGKGISKGISNTIFKPFMKSQDSTGLGLGMSIIDRSLSLINGSIFCIPSKEGAIFNIKLNRY